MIYSGVIDRIEDGNVVVLIEENNQEIKLNPSQLPAKSEEGSWLTIELDGESTVNNIKLNQSKTEEIQTRVDEKLNHLKTKSKGSKFKKK
ncbi:DUF3006 domain-containing protein [Aquisalibacillus elongatus]|uniref:DUF3006 family protein n=1 Tax=Aquisalibacillus elongatus TaxID=485577 RepID=A0A3N5BEG9_9BACI|nr:DUF3006 domain-containing protein [Aquisalibacillus elongatus]RPF55863.1 DUF3006 family protein [Aquisalibacillus elongatus]